MNARTVVLAWAVAAAALPRGASAQASRDSLRLDVLQTAAERHDPRARQLAIREAQAALRLRTIADERFPSITGSALAQYQSVVTEFPAVPGRPAVSLLHETYDAHVELVEPLLDPTRSARAAAERAQLARARADVTTALYAVRQQVNASCRPLCDAAISCRTFCAFVFSASFA